MRRNRYILPELLRISRSHALNERLGVRQTAVLTKLQLPLDRLKKNSGDRAPAFSRSFRTFALASPSRIAALSRAFSA
jgi:hypothetical protein